MGLELTFNFGLKKIVFRTQPKRDPPDFVYCFRVLVWF